MAKTSRINVFEKKRGNFMKQIEDLHRMNLGLTMAIDDLRKTDQNNQNQENHGKETNKFCI